MPDLVGRLLDPFVFRFAFSFWGLGFLFLPEAAVWVPFLEAPGSALDLGNIANGFESTS
jgi:hypothetical protein